MLNIQNWKKGQTGAGIHGGGLEEKETTPPKPYDEAMLLRDMEGAARFIKDDAMRESMKKADGIGTPATRAAIIEKLKAKDKNGFQFFKEIRSKLRATDEADQIIATLEKAGPAIAGLTDVVMTAMWESGLKQVETGHLSLTAFMSKQNDYVRKFVESADSAKTGIEPKGGKGGSGPRKALGKASCADIGCDKSGELTLVEGKFGPYWSCSLREQGCVCKIGNDNGRPYKKVDPPAEAVEPLPGSGDKCPTCKKGVLTTRKVSNPDSKAFGKRILVCTKSCKFMKGEWVFEKEGA
jgi:hypothetical protein